MSKIVARPNRKATVTSNMAHLRMTQAWVRRFSKSSVFRLCVILRAWAGITCSIPIILFGFCIMINCTTLISFHWQAAAG
ncbi:hypothetical protein D3C75_1092110 [compost metagenome]